MNAQLRRAAKACLYSTVTGIFLGQGGLLLAQSVGRVTHADAEEAVANEPATASTLGEASALPTQADQSRGVVKPAAASKAKAKSKSKSKAKPKPASSEAEEDAAIEQTGGFFKRSNGMQRPLPAQPQHLPANPATKSAVQRELEELYRRNGREMPEMNLQEMPTQQIPGAPAQPPAGYDPSAGSPSGNQRASKPNLLERVFGGSRSRSKTPIRTATPSKFAGSQPAAPARSTYTPPAPATLPPPEPAPYRPNGTTTTVAPGHRPQPLPLAHEPTPLAPDNEPAPQAEPRTLQAPPARSTRQPFLLDDSRSQSSAQSPEAARSSVTAARPAPQIIPNQKPAPKRVESPYTGLTIIPNESEGSIASVEELGKPATKPASATRPTANAAAQKTKGPKKAAEPTNSVLQHPLADGLKPAPVPTPPTSAATPAAAATAPAAKPQAKVAARTDSTDDEESLELDDPAEEKEPNTPAKAQQKQPAPLPVEEPIFPEPTTAAPAAGATSATKPDNKGAIKPVSGVMTTALKGICLVVLKDERRLVESQPPFKSECDGRIYLFSSAEAKTAFDANPQKYVPAGGGKDVVRRAGGDVDVEGTLEHAAWYRGRLYLFSSSESRSEFIDAPSKFCVAD